MIKKYFTYIHYAFTAILIIVLLFCLNKCSSNGEKAEINERNLNIQIKGFEKKVSSAGDTIYKMGQMIVEKNSQVAKLIQENEAIRKVKAQVQIKEVFTIKEVQVPFEKLVLKNCDSTGANYMKLPATYSDSSSKWYTIHGAIDKNGKNKIDRFDLFSDPVVTFGYAKKPIYKRLFKAEEPIVTYTNNNPYMRVTNMKNIVIEDKKKGRFGLSFHVGYGTILPSFKSGIYFGIGGDYRIISF